MREISFNLLFNFFLFLSFPFLAALILRKIKLPAIIGYILGGLIFGNFFRNLSINEVIGNFAYFGILLLLFTVGLETNFNRILNFKKLIFLVGVLQILLTIFFIFILGLFFKLSVLTSFLISLALSSSSTTLVAKIIQDRGEESSFLGEIAMAILLFQDIAFIPFLIIFNSITSSNLSFFHIFTQIFLGLIKSTIIIILLFYLGQKVVPYIFNKISRISRELLNLFIILFIFFVTSFSIFLGIPTLVGVFIAGVLLAQTIQHHHIFTEVRPLRDILAVIFFVYIGTNIDLSKLIFSIPKVFFFSLFTMLIKMLIIFFIFLILRFHTKTSFNLALYLFQIDEDAFILMSTAFLNKVVSSEDYLLVLFSVVISLMLTPILVYKKEKIYLNLRKFIEKYLPFLDQYIKRRLDSHISPIDEVDMKDHVVICGYGRVGSYIGRSLMMANIPYIAIDYNFRLVEKAKREGVNIIYGDPSDIEILDYAQVDEASILVLAVPERGTQEEIVLNAKKLNKDIFIISRVHRQTDHLRMKDLGVNVVVQPEFEASLSIIKKIYLAKRLEKEEIINKIKRLKLEHGLA